MRPLPLATGADLGPFTRRRYREGVVGYYWDSSVLSVWAYPSQWNDSPLASPAVLAVRPSHLAAPSAFWDSPWDVVSIWRTPQDWLAVSALGYRRRQAD
jgi:hypothetical protein